MRGMDGETESESDAGSEAGSAADGPGTPVSDTAAGVRRGGVAGGRGRAAAGAPQSGLAALVARLEAEEYDAVRGTMAAVAEGAFAGFEWRRPLAAAALSALARSGATAEAMRAAGYPEELAQQLQDHLAAALSQVSPASDPPETSSAPQSVRPPVCPPPSELACGVTPGGAAAAHWQVGATPGAAAGPTRKRPAAAGAAAPPAAAVPGAPPAPTPV